MRDLANSSSSRHALRGLGTNGDWGDEDMPYDLMTRAIILGVLSVALSAALVAAVRRMAAEEDRPARTRIVRSAVGFAWVATVVSDAAGWIAS